jgi:PilZ domain
MQAVPFPARRARRHYRLELRTLTYVTLDAANGGIVRNLNSRGVAVQAVAPLREQQRVRVRFELRFPRLKVEAHGEVSWSTPSGQCGICFVDLPARTRREIDEWIFSNLLESMARQADQPGSMFGDAAVVPIAGSEKPSGLGSELTLSAAPHQPIRIAPISDTRDKKPDYEPDKELNWLSRPLSGRTLVWLVNSLVVFAALLLFALTFLSITHELPQWPVTLGATLAAAAFVAAVYWALFAIFGGASLGARLVQASGLGEKKESDEAGRFR